MNVIKILCLFLILLSQLNCRKQECRVITPVGVSFKVNPDEIRSIELHFFDGARIVKADIIYPHFFENGQISWTYPLENVRNIDIVYRLYGYDGSWNEYRYKVK